MDDNSRSKTPEQALERLSALCAKGERAESDARRLMYQWRISTVDQEKIMEYLTKNRYIDNRRYAEAYVREKVRFSGWGEYKIRAGLSAKGINREIADEVLSSIDTQTINDRLHERLYKKNQTITTDNSRDRYARLMRYGLSLGYEYEVVSKTVERLTLTDEY